MERIPPYSLRLLLVATLRPESWIAPERLDAALRGGVTLVEARGKGFTTGDLVRRCREMLQVCRSRGVPLVVNDRPDIAVAIGAEGAHVGPDDLPPPAARRVLGDAWLGVSVRDPGRLEEADAAGADYLGVGALRRTGSKTDATVIGLAGIADIVWRTQIPVVAIGGVTPADLPDLHRIGVAGVAVGSGILDQPDPEAAARSYLR